MFNIFQHKAFIIAFLLAFTLFLTLFSCGGDDDDNQSSDDDNGAPEPNPGCAGDAQPEFLGLALIVNGVEVETPATILTTDEMQLAIEYSDADCNVDGGEIYSNNSTSQDSDLFDYISHYYKLENTGCSTEELGHPYYLMIDPHDFLLPEGLVRTAPINFHLYDVCFSCSIPDRIPLDFTVVEE